jgi:hypothetical protein
MSYTLSKLFTIDLECDKPLCDMIGYYSSREDINECHNNAIKAGWKVGHTTYCPLCNIDASKDS